MATIKSYTDLVQSKKLAEILPLESADYCWGIDDETLQYNSSPYPCAWKDYTCKEYYIPCWSLAALFGVLPKFIGDYSKCLYYDVDGCYCGYMNDGDFMLTIKETKAGNPVDACVKMIERLHELNLL